MWHKIVSSKQTCIEIERQCPFFRRIYRSCATNTKSMKNNDAKTTIKNNVSCLVNNNEAWLNNNSRSNTKLNGAPSAGEKQRTLRNHVSRSLGYKLLVKTGTHTSFCKDKKSSYVGKCQIEKKNGSENPSKIRDAEWQISTARRPPHDCRRSPGWPRGWE